MGYFSSKVLEQIFQIVIDDRFHQLDKGHVQNMASYGQLIAPDYPIENITSTNIAVYKGLNDQASDLSVDVDLTYNTYNVKILTNL